MTEQEKYELAKRKIEESGLGACVECVKWAQENFNRTSDPYIRKEARDILSSAKGCEHA